MEKIASIAMEKSFCFVSFSWDRFVINKKARRIRAARSILALVKKIGGRLSINYATKLEKQYIGMPKWVEVKKINQVKFYNSINNVELIKKVLNRKKHEIR